MRGSVDVLRAGERGLCSNLSSLGTTVGDGWNYFYLVRCRLMLLSLIPDADFIRHASPLQFFYFSTNSV